MAGSKLPPFSLFHNYEVEWGKFRRENPKMHMFQLTEAENRILSHLCLAGVMTRSQIYEIGWNGSAKRKHVRRLVGFRLIDEHVIRVNGSPFLFYTPCGVNKKYELDELLQRFVFNQLYIRLREISPFQIVPAPLPFAGALRSTKKMNMVCVVKNNLDALRLSLKSNMHPLIFVFEDEKQHALLREYVKPDSTVFFERELFHHKQYEKQYEQQKESSLVMNS
ncbi:hypothetical protein [Aneurinibacillus thermoaerophilus]|jgi:hypothetical protein|uniref:hypothetical protein n=1 Tax=Aneurinibacillus thermoaerophilus TaxID=143495 RepID=UPI002E240B88|nr:hypothetical protein [Aneurinibacillus thermoaerophilus]